MKKILTALRNLPLVAASAALILSILLCFMNVVTRKLFSFTFNGFDAMMTLCFGYTVFVGSAAAYEKGMHYGVDVLVSALPAGAKAAAKVALDVVMVMVMVCGTYLSVVLSVNALGKTMEGLNIPYFWYDLAAVIGFGYSTVFSLEFLWRDVRALRAPASDPKGGAAA